MTPEQWQEIKNQLTPPWGAVRLRVDGFKLTIEVRPVGELRYGLVPFVNGVNCGAWLLRDNGSWCEEARRFLQLRKRRLFSAAMLKNVRKKTAKELGLLESFEYRQGHWTSFAALKRHLIANNETIELVSEELPKPIRTDHGKAYIAAQTRALP